MTVIREVSGPLSYFFSLTPQHSMIYISNLRLHAFHGVLPQERIVGNDYIINLSVDYPIDRACVSDDVADTMNYAEAAGVIKEQMAVQSNLLENVAYRIVTAILQKFTLAKAATIDIRKVAPPMPFDCDGAGVCLTMKREDM